MTLAITGTVRSTLAAALCALMLASCTSGASVPMTRNYRDPKKDKASQIEYYETAAITYFEGGRFNNSIEMWAKVLDLEPERKKAKWGIAQAFAGKGDPQSLRMAEAYLLDIVNLDWKHPELGDRKYEVQKDLANVHSALADYYDQDTRMLERRLETDPNADVQGLERAIAKQKGLRDAELRKALPLYGEVLKASPKNPYAMAGLAKSHLILGNEDVGLGWAKQYIDLTQRNQEQWKSKMLEWEKLAGQGNVTTEQRDFFLDKLQGARTKEKQMHLLVGSVYMRRSEFDRAVKSYSRVIEMDPAVPAAYIERAQGYAALRQYSLAVRDVEEYLKITDPAKHRDERVNAAQLLDRYQRVLRRDPLLAGTRPG
mgnify:CR=1 FL=1